MPCVYISIGSNVDKARNIRQALLTLYKQFNDVTCSSVYESRPVGFEGETFYNLAAAFTTELDPMAVRKALHAIEARQGRRRSDARFGPRTLDLDLLLYDDLVEHNDEIDVPRAEIMDYAFILLPMKELAPTLKHPESGMTFTSLWKDYRGDKSSLWPIEFAIPKAQ